MCEGGEEVEPTHKGPLGRGGTVYPGHRAARKLLRCSRLCRNRLMGMKRSWRAARRVAPRRSGDSSRRPAATTACTASAEAGARALPAEPAAPPPGLAPRGPHSPSPLPAKVSGPMGPPGLSRFFPALLGFYARNSQACPLSGPVIAAPDICSLEFASLSPRYPLHTPADFPGALLALEYIL